MELYVSVAKRKAPPKPTDLIDREHEWQTPSAMWETNRPELVFVLGRRRVGKSFALARFAREVSAFVPDYSPEDRITTYGMVGGLPGHLSLLDPARDVAGNAADLLLDPAGRLVDEAQHMLDAFLADAAVHCSMGAGGSTPR